MATRLGDLLDDARRRTFVGRRRELASFDDVLLGRSARRVLLVHGPGGIGPAYGDKAGAHLRRPGSPVDPLNTGSASRKSFPVVISAFNRRVDM